MEKSHWVLSTEPYKNTSSLQLPISGFTIRYPGDIFVDNHTPAKITLSTCWAIDHLYGQKLEISRVILDRTQHNL